MSQVLVEDVRKAAREDGRAQLRIALVVLDVLAVTVAWTVALVVPFASLEGQRQRVGTLAVAAAAVAAGQLMIRVSLLYRARVCDSRAVEVERLLRVAAVTGVVAYIGVNALDLIFASAAIVVGTVLTFAGLCAVRGAYRSALRSVRKEGRLSRPVVVLGTNEEGIDLVRSLQLHPELGYRVAGVMGNDVLPVDLALPLEWLGSADDVVDTVAAVEAAGANGVIIAASAFGSEHTNRLARTFLSRNVHVHISTGLQGIGTRRMRPHRLAYDTVFYLEPVSLERWQLALKRILDVAATTAVMVVALPVMAVAAVLIKLEDRGPVLFRQERVGQGGRTFGLLKLRTMVVDAEARLAEVQADNARGGGPLFKATRDPRVTRIGRILRATSIDELPQLFNVLSGKMSLVGPRPALPREVEQFPDRLRLRENVAPGITGLWQIEARDNPSFRAYERFDLYYVENWSIVLDIAILMTTASAVAHRALTILPRTFDGTSTN